MDEERDCLTTEGRRRCTSRVALSIKGHVPNNHVLLTYAVVELPFFGQARTPHPFTTIGHLSHTNMLSICQISKLQLSLIRNYEINSHKR